MHEILDTYMQKLMKMQKMMEKEKKMNTNNELSQNLRVPTLLYSFFSIFFNLFFFFFILFFHILVSFFSIFFRFCSYFFMYMLSFPIFEFACFFMSWYPKISIITYKWNNEKWKYAKMNEMHA